jgi:U-box domain
MSLRISRSQSSLVSTSTTSNTRSSSSSEMLHTLQQRRHEFIQQVEQRRQERRQQLDQQQQLQQPIRDNNGFTSSPSSSSSSSSLSHMIDLQALASTTERAFPSFVDGTTTTTTTGHNRLGRDRGRGRGRHSRRAGGSSARTTNNHNYYYYFDYDVYGDYDDDDNDYSRTATISTAATEVEAAVAAAGVVQHVPTVDDPSLLSFMPVCSITQEHIRRPVIAADGHTYEYDAIMEWFTHSSSSSSSQGSLQRGFGCCRSPMTNLPLQHTNLVPNYAVIEMSERAAKLALASSATTSAGVKAARSTIGEDELQQCHQFEQQDGRLEPMMNDGIHQCNHDHDGDGDGDGDGDTDEDESSQLSLFEQEEYMGTGTNTKRTISGRWMTKPSCVIAFMLGFSLFFIVDSDFDFDFEKYGISNSTTAITRSPMNSSPPSPSLQYDHIMTALYAVIATIVFSSLSSSWK